MINSDFSRALLALRRLEGIINDFYFGIFRCSLIEGMPAGPLSILAEPGCECERGAAGKAMEPNVDVFAKWRLRVLQLKSFTTAP